MKAKVYLAGGHNSDWREKVKVNHNVKYFDPKFRPNWRWSEYGTWDVYFVKQCDICFAFMEKSNPSGLGMAAEMGYAKALGKTVIFVLEPGHEKEKHLQFLKQFADVVFDNLSEGIEYLKKF